jgi:hypothetical protein
MRPGLGLGHGGILGSGAKTGMDLARVWAAWPRGMRPCRHLLTCQQAMMPVRLALVGATQHAASTPAAPSNACCCPEKPPTSFLVLMWEALHDPMIIILLIVAVVRAVTQ